MRMLNDKRWKETKRIVWERANGLCEWCIRDGKSAGVDGGWIRAGVDCHHLVPFESARTTADAERLCYDANNVVLLCVTCHVKAHKELRSKSKEAVKARREQRFERWIDKMKGNGDK
jgi:5-methylcytosine-specific restriction endonuclease McrA